MKTVIAVYDDFNKAAQVIDALVKSGFDRADISVVANDSSGEFAQHLRSDGTTASADSGDVKAPEGAGFGALTGALTGLLVGLGALMIPGIGPVIAAGPIVTALASAGIGGAAGALTGGIVAALVDLGVNDEDAGLYAEGIRRGGTLLAVKVRNEVAENAAEIMRSGQPIDIDASAAHWREQGWERYIEQDKPYSAQDVNRSHDLFIPQSYSGDIIRIYGYDFPPR